MWWGVVAALLANVLYSTGFVLEKRALGGLPALTVGRPVRLLLLLIGSPMWLAGSLALAAGFAAFFAFLAFLAICSPSTPNLSRASFVPRLGGYRY